MADTGNNLLGARPELACINIFRSVWGAGGVGLASACFLFEVSRTQKDQEHLFQTCSLLRKKFMASLPMLQMSTPCSTRSLPGWLMA